MLTRTTVRYGGGKAQRVPRVSRNWPRTSEPQMLTNRDQGRHNHKRSENLGRTQAPSFDPGSFQVSQHGRSVGLANPVEVEQFVDSHQAAALSTVEDKGQ